MGILNLAWAEARNPIAKEAGVGSPLLTKEGARPALSHVEGGRLECRGATPLESPLRKGGRHLALHPEIFA
jgi:hypothetical protein